jgi:hypothetical protein
MSKSSLKQNMSANQVANEQPITRLRQVIDHKLQEEKRKKEFSK